MTKNPSGHFYLACQVLLSLYSPGERVVASTAGCPAGWRLLRICPSRYVDFVESELRRDHDLTLPRYDVLAQLDLAGGRLGLSELAALIWLSPSGLSKLLDRMEASGPDRS